jgi:Carboxyl transferase domain
VEPFRRHRATGFGLENRKPYTDGVVTGWGEVYGRTVFVFAHDFRIFGGALGEAHAEKIHPRDPPGSGQRAEDAAHQGRRPPPAQARQPADLSDRRRPAAGITRDGR